MSNMTEPQPIPPLLALPSELVLLILSHLIPPDLAHVAQTCRGLAKHSYDDRLWQPIVNANISKPAADPKPLNSFYELFVAHHPYWFLPRHRIWFSDTSPNGKLVVCRYDPSDGSIVAYTVVAWRGDDHSLVRWEKDDRVIVHRFNPQIGLDLERPVLRLSANSLKLDDRPPTQSTSSDAPSRYSNEVIMEMFAESGLYSSFTLCRQLPSTAIFSGTHIWPPLRFPATARARNSSRNSFDSAGHRPSRLSEISENNFRLRKWVEYNGRRSSPQLLPFASPNGLAAALGLTGSLFSTTISTNGTGGMSIRMPEDVTTFATLPRSCYTPTPSKPWQGIWCGDYSGHGCEFIMIQQPDAEDAQSLPEGMDWLAPYFAGPRPGTESTDLDSDSPIEIDGEVYESARSAPDDSQEDKDGLPEPSGSQAPSTDAPIANNEPVPSGRLEALKLTGDMNIPRAEYTFIAPDLGDRGLVRIADEEIFRGARVVRSAGHIAGEGFVADQYMPSQLILLSHNTLAQFWTQFGHISYYQRVDLDALVNYTGAARG